MLYLDNGPVVKSRVFQGVMLALGVNWLTHLPAGKDGERVTSRSKGKVERPFRTVKEAHETLYHFHKPETEQQANAWLLRYLLHYNEQPHRSLAHSGKEDWLTNLPPEGIRDMCNWEQFCRFAREPERRKGGAMPVSRLKARRMRLIRIWPGKLCCCSGDCLTVSCMLNLKEREPGLITQPRARFT